MKAYIEIEMPESCVDCPISGYSGLFERNCQLVNDEVSIAVWDEKVGANFPEGYIFERHPKCPIKPQYKLICADELIERIKRKAKDYSLTMDYGMKMRRALNSIINMVEEMVAEQKGETL